MASNNTVKYTIQVGLDRTSVQEVKETIQDIKKSINDKQQTNGFSKELSNKVKQLEQLEKLLNSSWNEKLNTTDPYKFNNGLRQIYGNMHNLRKEMTDFGSNGEKAFDIMASSVLRTNTQMTQSSKILNKIADSFGKTLGWGITSSVVNNFSRAIQGAWGYVQHLDKSLNNIRIVSGESAANMEKFAKQANAAAKSLGTSTLDYTDAALIYYQQGLDEKQVAERTETTLKMANVIGVDAATVSSYMTGIWNNFDDGTKSLEYFGDALVALGASTAASSSEIAEGLTKFAAIADTVGLSYEYATSALATVVAATRQSAEVVGTAFKTIFARMEDLKLGETIEDGTDIGKYAQGLAAVGISIKDSSGQLKDMDTLLDEMGAKWQTLSRDQQVALAQVVAGIRQYSQLVALMDNWDTMKDNIQTAANATGTLQQQQETYMESMQAHFQGLTTEWQRTYDIIFNPDTMNETVDVVTKLLETFNDFIEGIGGGSKAIIYFASLFTNLLSKQIGGGLHRIISNIEKVKENRRILKSDKEFSEMGKDENSEHPLMGTIAEMNAEAEVIIPATSKFKKILEEEIEDYKEILKIEHLLTEEEQQQLKSRVVNIADLKRKAQETERIENEARERIKNFETKAGLDITNAVKGIINKNIEEAQSVEEIGEAYDEVKNNIKEYISLLKTLEEKEKELSENKSKAKKSNVGFVEIAKERQQTKKEFQTAENEWNKIKNDYKDKRSALKESIRNNQEEATKERMYYDEHQYHSSDKAAKIFDDYNSAIEALNKLEETKKKYDKLQEDFNKINEKYQKVALEVRKRFDEYGPVKDAQEEVNKVKEELKDYVDNLPIEDIKNLDKSMLEKLMGYIDDIKEVNEDKANAIKGAYAQLEKEQDDFLKSKEKVEKYAKAIQIASLAIQGFTTVLGTAQEFLEANDESLSEQEKHLQKIQAGTSAVTGLLSTAAFGLGTYFSGGDTTVGVLASTVVGSVGSFISSIFTNNAKKEVERIKKAAEQAAKDLEESLKKLEEQRSLQDTYSKSDAAQEWQVLIAGVDEYGNNISLTNEEYNKYLQYCKEMAEVDASLIDGYNREGQAIITTKNAIEQMNNALEKQIQITERESISGKQYEARLNEIQEKSKESKDSLKSLMKNIYSDLPLAYELVAKQKGVNLNDLDSALEYFKNLKSGEIESKGWLENIDSYSFDEVISKLQEASDKINNLKEGISGLNEIQDLAYLKATNGSAILAENFNKLSNQEANLIKYFSTNLTNEDLLKNITDPFEKTWLSEAFKQDSSVTRAAQVEAQARQLQSFIEFFNNQSTEEINNLFNEIINLDFESQDAYNNAIEELKNKLQNTGIDSQLMTGLLEAINVKDGSNEIIKLLNEIENKYNENAIDIDEEIKELSPKDLKDFNNYLKEINYNITENTYKFFKQSQATKEFASSLSLLDTQLEVAGKALSEFAKDGKISEDTLKSLEAQYAELAEITDKTSHQYVARLRELREKTEQDKIDRLEEEKNRLNKVAKEYEDTLDELFGASEQPPKDKKIEVKIKANLEQYEKTMDQIINANYQTYVTINADLKTDVENALGLSKEFDALKEYVAEDLTVSLEDVQKIIDAGYGGMLINAKKTTEGRILLDKEAMNVYIDNRQTELEADKQSKIAQLKNQREVLVAQKNILETKLGHIRKALSAETESDRAAALNEVELDEKIYQNQKDLLVDQLEDEEKYANEKLDIQKDMFSALGGMYETDSDNQQAAANAIQENNNKNAEQEFNNQKALRNILLDINKIKWDTANGKLFNWKEELLSGDSLDIDEEKTKKHFKTILENLAHPYVSRIGNLVKGIFTDTTEETKNEIGLLSESVDNTLRLLEKQTQEQIDLLTNQIGEIDGSIAAMESTSEQLDTLQEFAKEATKEGIDLLEVEIDKYHDINLALKDIETQLKRVQAAQKNLFGEDLKNNLNEQLDLLATQKDLNNQKMKIAEADAKERRAALSAQGVTFDENGLISNYWAALQGKMNYVNDLTMQYNSMSEQEQKDFKETLDNAKKDYEKFQKQISEYDTLISETIPGIEDAIQDAFNKEIEIKISKFNTSIDIRLNMKKAEQDFNTFKDKVIDQLKDDDILGRANSELRNYSLYYNQANTGAIQATTAQVKNLLQELNKMDSTGSSSIYGNNRKQLLDDLAKYKNELTTLLTEEQTLVESIKKEYLSMIDEATNKFKEHISQYQYIEELLKHDINLIGLLYGDKAYAEMDTYYKKIEENNNKNLAFLRDTASYYKEMMDAATDDDSRKKWEAAWEESLKNLNSATESAIKNIQDKYKNGIKEIFKEWEESLTNGSDLSWVEESWERVKAQSEAYLDDINREFEIRNFQRNAKEALNDNTSLKAQSQITKVMNEQLETLKEKENLSKYDVERANKMLDITLKQIALEDARNNKSQMRLRRDSQGNYSYQFVADADEIAKAEEELEKAKNELYNFDKSELTKSQDEAIKMLKEFEEKIIALYENNNLSPEARAKRELELKKYYGERINALIGDNEQIRINLIGSATMSIEDFLDSELQAFLNMNDQEKNSFLGDLVPAINSGVQDMINVFAGSGGFEEVCSNVFTNLKDRTEEYKNSLNELEQSAGKNFAEIKNGIDKTTDSVQELIPENDKLLQQYKDQVSAVQNVVSQLDQMTTSYNNNRDAAIEAADAAQDYYMKAQEAAAQVNQLYEGVSRAKNAYTSFGAVYQAVTTGNNNTSSNGVGAATTATSAIKSGKMSLTVLHEDVAVKPGPDSAPMGMTLDTLETGHRIHLIEMIKDANYPYYIEYEDKKGKKRSGWINSFASGGYTGDWNSNNGRMAVLHEKELVLNKEDTHNLLEMVNIARASYKSILMQNLSSRITSLLGGLNSNNLQYNTIPSPSGSSLDQNVNIEANFPAVRDAVEIKEALNNLINVASQRANYQPC